MSVLKRRRRHKGERQPEVNLASVVVPMLDMSFQILFFFVVTFNPPTNEGQFPFAMTAPGGSNSVPPLDAGDDVTLVVVSSDNPEHPALTGWRIEKPATNSQISFSLADGLEKVERALEEIEKTKPDASKNISGTKLKVQLDGKMRYSDVIDAMNVGKQAGFENILMEIKGGFLSRIDSK